MTTATLNPPDSELTIGAFRLESEGSTGFLWFDLPGEKVNKLSSSVMADFEKMIESIGEMKELERIIILSAKENIFIAGADVSEFQRVPSADEARKFTGWGQQVFMKLSRLPQVTLAVIHGACMGGGTEMALNCDYRVVTDWDKSIIALPETKLGIIPAWSGTTKLPRLVGIPAALDMILTGKSIRPKSAKKMMLVDDVIPATTRLEAAKIFIAGKRKQGDRGNTHFYLEGNPLARKVVFNKARETVQKQSGGHYPAVFKAIDVMELSFHEGIEAGLAAEAKAAAELITGDVAPNLVRLFFMMEDSKKGPDVPPGKVEYVGVLGAGLMGGGITQTLVDKASVSVRMKDINWDALAGGMQAAAKIWKKKVDRHRMKKTEMDLKMAMITTTTDWSGFSRADVVIEAVIEKIEIKQQVLREFEEVGKESAIFATNTSTIPITRIAEASKRPEQVIGMHFFSPVDKMPLVEIIKGEKTSIETVSTIASLARNMGKTVVICNDGPGFIVNRILGPYLNEAGFLVEEGVSVDSIDSAMVRFGMPLGPLALLDEVGIDVAGKAAQVLAEAFGDRIRATSLIGKLIADKRYGKKNMRGVYLWEKGKRTEPDPSIYKLVGVSEPKPGDSGAMVERMILAMINETALLLDEKIATSAADVDLAMIMGTGFPPFRGGLLRYADTLGIDHVLARMDDLAATLGDRFTPTEPLRKIGKGKKKSFYESYPKK